MKLTASFRSLRCLAIIVVTSLCAISARGQELVNDGGFEASPDVFDQANPFSAAWTVVDNTSPGHPTGTEGSNSNVGADSVFANNGLNFANLGAVGALGSLSQILTTSAGGTYTLSFWLANDSGVPPNQFDVYWDGTLISSQIDSAFFGYTQVTFTNLSASGTSTPLEFCYRNDDDYFRLDDVSVTAAVPEPSTVSFAALGLGLLGLSAYGRAKARRA